MEGGMDGEELKRLTKEEISRRIREGVKAVIEQVLEEEMTEHLAAGYRERTPSRRGERNGHYTRDLITPAGRIAQLRVPRDREGTFLTEVFERYKRMTGEVEEAVLEMYLQGVSTRKVAAITEGLSRVRIGKDAVSRVAQRLEEELSAWRGRPLELAYPYLYLDAAYFKVNWGGRVVDLALLVAVGVNEEGYREVLAVEPAGGERKEAWRNLLKGLVERGLRGVRLVISDDHPSIRQAVMAELPGASWQRCVVHFMRNVLAHVPQSERGVVAAKPPPRHPHLVHPFGVLAREGQGQVGLQVGHPVPGVFHMRKTLGGRRAFRAMPPGRGVPSSQATPPFLRTKRPSRASRTDPPRRSPKRSQPKSAER
jgi:putative transposase